MIQTNFGADFIVACVYVGATILAGLFMLFVRAENIERPFVVSGLTLSGALFSLILLDHLKHTDLNFGFGSLLLVCLVATVGFALGRLIDWILGPRSTYTLDGESLDTNLAD